MKAAFKKGEVRKCHTCGTPFRGGAYAAFCAECRRKRYFGGYRYARIYNWTPEQDEVIRRRWKRGMVASIPAALGLPTTTMESIKRRAAEIGCLPIQRTAEDSRPWTKEDLAFLEEHASGRTVFWIGKQLGRSGRAVRLKLFRLGISSRVTAADGYTIHELAQAMGEQDKVVRHWCDLGYFGRIQYRYGEDAPAYQRDPRVISPLQVLTFLKAQPTAYRLDRVDQPWFLDLVFNAKAIRNGRAA